MIGPAMLAVLALVVAIAIAELVGGVRAARRVKRSTSAGMADYLLYRRLVRPDVIKLSNGGFLAMFEVNAPDAGAFSDVELAVTNEGIGRALGAISERFIVHLRERHEASYEYDAPSSYPHPVLEWLDNRRRDTFTSGTTFRTRRVISLAWLPPSGVTAKAGRFGTIKGDAGDEPAEELVDVFERELASATSFLRSYASLRRLSTVKQRIAGVEVERSEMLEELARCVSGRSRRVSVPRSLVALNSLLSEPMRGGSDVRVGESEVAIVVVKDFPSQTEPLALARLRQLTADYDLVVRWMPLTPAESRKLLNAARAEWRAVETEGGYVDPFASEMIAEGQTAAGMIRERVRFGIMATFVVLRAPDRRTVDAIAQRALAIFDELSWSAFIAADTAEEDFFASLPADGYHGVRGYQLHGLNLAHAFSLHEQTEGSRYLGVPYLPRTSPALTYAAGGKDGSLLRLSLATDPADVLHYLGVGGTGLGKSTSLGFLVAMWLGRVPYSGVTVIDRGRSMYRLARFLGVPYYDLLASNAPGLALFSDVETPEGRISVARLLVAMCEAQGVAVSPPRRAALDDALDAIATLRPHLRSLSAYVELVQDPEGVVRPALRLYTRNGPLGRTLDAELDTFDVGRLTAVDLGAVWGMEPAFLIPVLMALFWKMRVAVQRQKEETGNDLLTWLFQIDEAHTLLGHELGQAFIRDMLKMGRREKFALGLWSNAAKEFATSPILNDLLEACKTRIYFRNTDVLDSAEVREFYESLTLPPHAIAMLPNLAPHSLLVHQPTIRELVEVNWRLDPSTLAVLGRTSHAQNRWLDEMIERFPFTWRQEVLLAEGVPSSEIDELSRLLTTAATEAAALETAAV